MPECDARRLTRAEGPWRATYKEAEEPKSPGLPGQAGFNAWKKIVCARVNQASDRPDDKALRLVRRVEDRRYPDEFFQQAPPIFLHLPRKIAVAIQAIVRGALWIKISILIVQYMKQFRSTAGLYLLRLILKEHATHHETDILFQITDLRKVPVRNGGLEQFLNTWDLIIAGMRPEDRPSEAHQRHFFHEAIKRVNALSLDMVHYERMGDHDPNRSYELLRRLCEKQIGRVKRSKAQQGVAMLSGCQRVALAKSGKSSRRFSPRHGATRSGGGRGRRSKSRSWPKSHGCGRSQGRIRSKSRGRSGSRRVVEDLAAIVRGDPAPAAPDAPRVLEVADVCANSSGRATAETEVIISFSHTAMSA